MHTNTLFLKTRASWGLGSNYNFLMICGRKRDWICINYVLFICFRNFNEFKGKIIHLNKKPLLSLNCVPPVVTSGSLSGLTAFETVRKHQRKLWWVVPIIDSWALLFYIYHLQDAWMSSTYGTSGEVSGLPTWKNRSGKGWVTPSR